MRNYLLLIVSLLISAAELSAKIETTKIEDEKSIIIKGVVVSEKDAKAVEYATVYIDGTNKGVITDSEGKFEIKNVTNGATLKVSCMGYQEYSIQIDASGGNIISLNIRLKPSSLRFNFNLP